MWVRGHSRSLKVHDTIWQLGYGFIFAFHGNYGRIFSHFGDIQHQAMAWPWNLGLGSFRVIENGAVRRQTMCNFLLVRHCKYSSVLYTVCELFDVEYYRDLEIWVRGHSRSLKLVPVESLAAVSYSPSIVTIAVSVAVREIFSVKEWYDLENRVRVRSRSLEFGIIW